MPSRARGAARGSAASRRRATAPRAAELEPPAGEGQRAGRERLLEAATALFAERGYAATPVSAICERAGLAKPALYWHFGSKEELLAEVVQRVGTTWIELLQKQAYQAAGPEARIDGLIRAWRRLVLGEPRLLRLLVTAQLEQGDSSERVREALLRVWQRAEQALVEGIEDTLGRSLPDLDLVAHTAITLLEGAMLRQIADPDERRLDRILEEFRRTIFLLIWARLAPGPVGVPNAG